MRQFLIVLLLLLPSLASAQVWPLPDGSKYIDDITNSVVAPKKIWAKFILPNGLPYWAEQIVFVPVAKAEELKLSLKEQIIAYASFIADKYGVDSGKFNALITCESNYDTEILGDKGEALGLLQWWKHSWKFYNKKYGLDLDRHSWRDQLELSARVLSEKDGWLNWKNCWRFIKYNTWNRNLWK